MTDPVVTEVKAAIAAEVSKFKAWETRVFAFLQAHYSKAFAAVVGFAASHFGVVAYLIGKVL